MTPEAASASASESASSSMSSSSLPKTIICVGDIFAAPFYIALTAAALLSVCLPVLRDLSAHGKTRLDATGAGTTTTTTTKRKKRPALLRRLSSDLLLVRKRRFLHFYVAGIAVTLLLFLLRRVEDQYYGSTPVDTHKEFGPQGLAVALLMMHLTRRCYECLYVHEWTDGGGDGKGQQAAASASSSTMHGAGYALGVLHYVVLPFVFLGSDGDHDWCCEFAEKPPPRTPEQRMDAAAEDEGGGGWWGLGGGGGSKGGGFGVVLKALVLFGGAGLVLLGQAEQYRAHTILGDLRRGGGGGSGAAPGQDADDAKSKSPYRIPVGHSFNYVSCPHYLAEICIYIGFVFLLHVAPARAPYHDVRCNLSSSVLGQLSYGLDRNGAVSVAFNAALNLEEYKHIALLVWVVTNLSISAMRQHAWYRGRFGERYPRRRKALVPFLW